MLARATELEQDNGLLADAGPPPTSWDWNERGHVTPARDQGACESCVAFATCAAIEARMSIISTGMHLDLSEAHLFSCGAGDACETGWQPEAALERARSGIGLEAGFP